MEPFPLAEANLMCLIKLGLNPISLAQNESTDTISSPPINTPTFLGKPCVGPRFPSTHNKPSTIIKSDFIGILMSAIALSRNE